MRKVWGQDRRICSLILGVKGLKRAIQKVPTNKEKQKCGDKIREFVL